MADRQTGSSSRVTRGLLTLVMLAAPLAAGSGTIQGGKLDLLVYFTYDEPNPTSWEPLFEEYSKLLLNATEGGLQLGTVGFTLCEGQKSQADVWVLNDTSGARAHLNGLGVSGRHMTISQTHKSTTGVALGQFGLVHETGHYAWGCYDEYKGFVGNTPQTHASHYCTSESGTSSCFMDGGTTVTPNNTRTEFCTDSGLGYPGTSHFLGVNQGGQAVRNDQEYFLGQSCWERIQASGTGALLHPNSPPVDIQPAHDDPVFDYARLNGVLAMALVIDTSGSMSSEDKMQLAIQSAQVAVGLMLDGEYLTVVGFDDDPTVVLPVSTISDATKATAHQRIGALVADGGTSAGDAMLTALAQLDQVVGCKEFVVLLSDGVSNEPDVDDPDVLAELQAGGYDVFSVALGSFSNDTALLEVATQTGGEFYKATTAEELPGTFATIFAKASGATALEESFEATVGAGDTSEELFQVSEVAGTLRISLSFPSGADLGLTLIDPAGFSIDCDAPPDGVGVFTSDVQKTLSVPEPLPGQWTARIVERSGSGSTFDFLAFLESFELDVSATAGKAEVVYPDPMQVSVSVVAGVPVGGASAQADVTRPDASVVAIEMFDDGLAVHGDEKADDGIYSALFTRYVGDGPYRFDIRVENVDGQAASNQECGIFGLAEEGQIFGAIPPFVACVQRTVLLSGLPQPALRGAVDVMPHTSAVVAEELGPGELAPTPVAAFSVEVSPAEPVDLTTITLDIVTAQGNRDLLEGLALHLDADGDGVVDRPSLPLAHARLDGDTALVFEVAGAGLAVLAPGSENRYLITLGEALESGAGSGSLGFSPGPPFSPPPAAWRWSWVAPFLLGLWFLLRGRMPRSLPRPAVSGAVGVLLVASLLVFAGCRDGKGSESVSDFGLALGPAGVELEGAVTGEAIPAGGVRLEYGFRLR